MNVLETVEALISRDRLIDTLRAIVDIPSPTGEELPLAQFIGDLLSNENLQSKLQQLTDCQANIMSKIRGQKSGKNILLYSPIDTVTSNNSDEDIPWAGSELRADMRAKSTVNNGFIIGLGAHNPKGHVACVIEAARVLKALEDHIAGEVYFGFGAGGMPTLSRPGLPDNTGHGVGCKKMLSILPKLDGAIIAKSGLAVTWEEVGFVWFEVEVKGTHTYVGSRHLLPYSNAIHNATKLISALEDWFEDWTVQNATDCVRPQGVVSTIEGGWKRMPAFTPACCKFRIDLRFGPALSADDAEYYFRKEFHRLNEKLGIEATYTRIQTIEASHTSPENPIILESIKSWEKVNRKKHKPFTEMSGATDANIIRQHGVPTSRVGLPKVSITHADFALGMNCVAIDDLVVLTQILILTTLNFIRST